MYKNKNMYVIDLEKIITRKIKTEQNILKYITRTKFMYNKWGGVVEDLLYKYLEGAQIVFVTYEKILLGGVTKGDICRLYRKNNNTTSLEQLINTNIKRIIFINEEQVLEDARIIFNSNNKINSIPVINKSEELMFQIDRFPKNILASTDLENISNAAKNGSIKCFLKSDFIKKIIITGSKKEFLYQTEQIFYEYCQDLISEQNIEIIIEDNIKKLNTINSDVKIISLDNIGSIYLNKLNNHSCDVVTAEELYYFSELKKVIDFNKDIVGNFIEIFKYKSIGFFLLNKYTSYFMKLLDDCGVKCFYLKENNFFDSNFEDNNLSVFDILLFSADEETYCEKENIIELIQHIELLQKYKHINGHFLEYNVYINECVSYLYKLYNKGFNGFIQEDDNLWKNELHKKIKETGNLEIVNLLEDIDVEKRYIDAYKSNHKIADRNFYMSTKLFLFYICEHAVYERVITKCKNVFIFSDMFAIYTCSVHERNRKNYLKNSTSFEDNFTIDICNNDKDYLTEVIKDRENCEIINFNDGYIKFSSNYHSKYFNTDLYGNRVVSYSPLKYLGKIWLAGGCMFNGYAVEDKHSFASFLQKKINSKGYKYKVIDLSCDNAGSVIKLYNKILERDIVFNDIVILHTTNFFTEQCFMDIDFTETNNSFKNKIWFWDIYAHMSFEGYKLWAEKIFNKIKNVMIEDIDNSVFYLENELELKIKDYISKIKEKLMVNKIYQSVFGNINFENKNMQNKIGAVVMNCNPFTYGHKYLIDVASKLVDLLYIFIVEENKSIFSFEDRFLMVRDGTREYNNIILLNSGEFMISSITFPGYFLKEKPTEKCYDDFLDLKIFAHYIAPSFGINIRFVGEEPFDKVTKQYNSDMKLVLKTVGIDVIEIPRKKVDHKIISATAVRELFKNKNYNLLKEYVPRTTMKYLLK